MGPISISRWKTRASMRKNGFTLIELLISMAIFSIMILAVYTSYEIQQNAFVNQRELARMESNLRAALNMIKTDLQNAGRGDNMTGQLGPGGLTPISECNRHNSGFNGGVFPFNNPDKINGSQGLTINMAVDVGTNISTGTTSKDGKADPMKPNGIRTVVYRIWDSDNDGRNELHRFDSLLPFNETMVADGIQDMSIAFGYSANGIGELDRQNLAATNNNTGPIIWAVDDDANPGVDTNLDNHPAGGPGVINDQDDRDGDGLINSADGTLNGNIPLNRLRAARIWLMARSNRQYLKYRVPPTAIYQVGHRVFRPVQAAVMGGNVDQFRYLVLESTVNFRNHERIDG